MELEKHLNEIQLKKLNVMLSGSDLKLSFVTRILAIENHLLTLQNTVPPEYISEFVDSSKHFLSTDSFRIKADKIYSDGVDIKFEFSEVEETAGTRSEERITIGAQNARCQFLNPFDQETIIEKKLLDFSKTGFSLVTSWNSELFQPNIEIPNITIQIDDTTQKVDGRIVYNRPFVNFEGRIRHQIGFRIYNKDTHGQ